MSERPDLDNDRYAFVNDAWENLEVGDVLALSGVEHQIIKIVGRGTQAQIVFLLDLTTGRTCKLDRIRRQSL